MLNMNTDKPGLRRVDMFIEHVLGAMGAPHTDVEYADRGYQQDTYQDTVDAVTENITLTHLALVPQPIDDSDDFSDEQWQERALCAQTDPEAFFPEKGGSTREAKRICLGCEVRDACLEYALANDERFGIWGGLSERERRRLKRGII